MVIIMFEGEYLGMTESRSGDHLLTILVTLGFIALLIFDIFYPPPLPDRNSLPEPLPPLISAALLLLFMFLLGLVSVIGKSLSADMNREWGKGFLTAFIFIGPSVLLIRIIIALSSPQAFLIPLDIILLYIALITVTFLSLFLLGYIDEHKRLRGNEKIWTQKLKVSLAEFGFYLMLGFMYLFFYWMLNLIKVLFNISDVIISEALKWWFRVLWLMLTLTLVIRLTRKPTGFDLDEKAKKKVNVLNNIIKPTIQAGLRQAVVIVILLTLLATYPLNLSLSQLVNEIILGGYILKLKLIHFVVKLLVWLSIPADWFYTYHWLPSAVTYLLVLLVFLLLRRWRLF